VREIVKLKSAIKSAKGKMEHEQERTTAACLAAVAGLQASSQNDRVFLHQLCQLPLR
jgi:hypothetical protein